MTTTAQGKPAPVAVRVECIPAELKDRPQWVVWRWVWSGKKWDKPPYRADGQGKASSTDPDTWSTFAEAEAAYRSGTCDGIGFVLSGDLTAVDLDDCTGEPWAVELLESFATYTESTPSGKGYHAILQGPKPQGMGCRSGSFHSGKVEVYDRGRYITVTGQRLEEFPSEIREAPLASLCAPLMPAPTKPSTATGGAAGGGSLAVLERIKPQAFALYHGHGAGEDHSAADLSLANDLAWLTGGDPQEMDRLFRGSALMRPKWDQRHATDGSTYGEMTIRQAIAGTRNFYSPSNPPAAPAPSPAADPFDIESIVVEEPERPGAFAIPESCKGAFAVRMGLDLARVTEMPQATAVLTALGAFSGILSMAYCTGYGDGQRLPLGLYTVAEQPPATSKSRLLNAFAGPWLRKVKRYNAERMAEAEEAEEEAQPRLLPLPFSNATPEAMEQAMTQDNTGHFWLQSAEQGAVRMLFGDGVKDRPKNFDLALKGFNGEFHSSARVSRQKLLREVYGAVTVLAQAGSIRTILSNSDGDGLAERFLFVAEPHNLGKRTHAAMTPDPRLVEGFDRALSATLEGYQRIPESKRGELYDLHYLGFSPRAHELLRKHKIRIEPKLAQHADCGEMVMTALLGKTDMQAMKLAAVMYLSDCLEAGKPYAAQVPDEYLKAGLELALAVVAHIEAVLLSMERIGPEAAREAIRRQFDKRPERTVRDVVQTARKVKPFKDNPEPSAYAKRIITGMINRGELLQVGNKIQLG